jgi:hypothetical protein
MLFFGLFSHSPTFTYFTESDLEGYEDYREYEDPELYINLAEYNRENH